MWDFLRNWNWEPDKIIILFMVIGLFLSAIVLIIAVSWSRVRRDEIRANLTKEMLQRGISVEQIERLAGMPSHERTAADGKALEAQLASLLVQSGCPAPTMEEVLRIYQETDPATKKAVYDSLEEIVNSSPSEEQLVGAVKALCPAHANIPPTGRFEELPARA